MAEDFTGWLTKQQAAEAIGVSTKTVEKLAQDRRLQQGLRRSDKGARVAVYHPGDVDRLRQEWQPGAAAFVVPAVEGNGDRHQEGALAPQLAPLPPIDQLLLALAAVARAASENSEKSENSSQKLFLTLDEAAAVTGLPRSHLRRLVKQGRLEATPTRPRLVRRRDLEAL